MTRYKSKNIAMNMKKERFDSLKGKPIGKTNYF